MKRAYLWTLAAVAAWSVGPVGSKSLLRAESGGTHLEPLQVAFWAISAGWVFLLAVLAARGRLSRLGDFSGRGWLVLFAMGVFGWAGYAVSLNFALVRLPLPDAIVINYLHPVFTVIFQGAMFGGVVRLVSGWEQGRGPGPRPGALRMSAGLLLCLAGVAVIATEGRLGALGNLGSPAGALAALFAAFAWGVYSNLGRFVAVKRGREANGLADVQTFAAMSFGLLVMAAALGLGRQMRTPTGYETLLYLGGSGPAEVSAWAVVSVVGLVVYCGGFTLWLAALELGRRVGEPHKLPPLTYLAPVLAVVLGWVFLRETFGPGFWQGAALIAVGNALNVTGRGGGGG